MLNFSAEFCRGDGKPQRVPETQSKSDYFQGISQVPRRSSALAIQVRIDSRRILSGGYLTPLATCHLHDGKWAGVLKTVESLWQLATY
jgi:hypothetical protein